MNNMSILILVKGHICNIIFSAGILFIFPFARARYQVSSFVFRVFLVFLFDLFIRQDPIRQVRSAGNITVIDDEWMS